MENINNTPRYSKFRVDNSISSSVEKATSVELDNEIQKKSENHYIAIVSDIVMISKAQLTSQRENKQNFRQFFGLFFGIFISVQYVALIVFMILSASCPNFVISDELIKVYIVSVFVETLGIVAVMVRFAFDTKHEVEILSTLNSIVEHFQKFKR